MVRPAKLTLALLTGLVVLGHLLGLEWISRQADQISGLSLMVPPMYTRMLRPATPPPVVAVATARPPARPRPKAAPHPRPPASTPEELRRKKEQERERREARARERQQAAAEAQEQARIEEQAQADARALAQEQARQEQAAQAEAAASAASEPVAAASAASAASAPSAASSAASTDLAALDRWPVDTRLSYALTGQYRGPLYGDARVQWQRQGDKYQVRLDVKIQVFGTQVFTSQGEVTPDGLVPRAYEELRPGKRRFATMGDEVIVLENGRTVPRPPGVQDTASQFVELTQRFASGREVLQVGHSVTVWLARPGGVDQWVYDVLGRDMLRTPKFGTVEAFHLKPRSITNPRGAYTMEIWFAPSLQYLPARIKLLMGDEAWLDLVVDHIEQR